MKAMKGVNAIIVAGMVILIAITGVPCFASVKINSFPGNPKFVKENADIRNDIANMKFYSATINCLKKKLKEDRKSGNRMAVIMDKRDLEKTRADLMKERAYLRADLHNLVCDHREAIRDARKTLRDDRAKLALYERKKSKTSSSDQVYNDKMVNEYKARVEKDKKALDQQKSELRSDLVAIRDEIRKPNDENNVGFACYQVSNYRSKNWMNRK